MRDYAAINLRATTAYGIEEFEIEDYPEADFFQTVTAFKSSLKDLDDGEETFYQVLPPATDGEYEELDGEYGIKRLKR